MQEDHKSDKSGTKRLHVKYTTYIYNMPRQALTHEDIETFRQRAVETATRLYAEEGYEAVTMRSLAHALAAAR